MNLNEKIILNERSQTQNTCDFIYKNFKARKTLSNAQESDKIIK